MTVMKEGDIFRWSWKNEKGRGFGFPYHCQSQIAVVGENGVPYDTYWSDQSRSLNPEHIETKYLGNANEMSKIGAQEVDYYRPEDVVDTRHSNAISAPIYLKAGATRDAETMWRAHPDNDSESAWNEMLETPAPGVANLLRENGDAWRLIRTPGLPLRDQIARPILTRLLRPDDAE